jgi:MFS family permease
MSDALNPTHSMPDKPVSSMWLPIAGTTFFRLVLNTARRFAYPFAPALSRGLGVSLSAVTSLIAVNQMTSLLGAVVGPLSDRLGYRTMMVAGLVLLGIGMLAAAGMGRVAGALMGTAVWHDGGIRTTGYVSGAMTILGLLCLVYGLREWQGADA